MFFAHITDLHIDIPEKESKLYPNSQRLRQVIGYLNHVSFKPRFVLIGGDVANDKGTIAEYQAAKSALAEFQLPFYLMPGNHDDRDNMKTMFPDHGYMFSPDGFIHYVIEQPEMDVIALDTVIPGKLHGALCEKRLAWLKGALKAKKDKPVLIAMHHPPFKVGIEKIDDLRCVEGVDELAQLLQSHGKVQGILCGHVHRRVDLMWHGIPAICGASIAPALELRLMPGQPLATWPEPPAAQIMHFDKDQGLIIHSLPFVEGQRIWEGQV